MNPANNTIKLDHFNVTGNGSLLWYLCFLFFKFVERHCNLLNLKQRKHVSVQMNAHRLIQHQAFIYLFIYLYVVVFTNRLQSQKLRYAAIIVLF